MTTPRRAAAVLAASEGVCEFLVRRGSTEATVAELSAAVGLNERTFYRYFPTKPDAVRPVFDWGAALMADYIAARRDLTIKDAVLASFALIVDGPRRERTRRLFPLVFADPSLRAVLLAVYHDAEGELRAAIGSRGALAEDSEAAHVAATTLVGVTRLAIELMVQRGADPLAALERCLRLLPDELVGEAAAVAGAAAPDHPN